MSSAPAGAAAVGSISEQARAIYVFANEKGVALAPKDRDAIGRIIMEVSGDSKYTQRQMRADARVDFKVQAMRATLAAAPPHARRAAAAQAERRACELEQSRRLDRICVVVDFDMFYAAVEIRDRPELAQRPVAVGGVGMISTANYVARAWGVRSAMPGFVGQALCRRGPEFGMPKAELVFVPPNFEKYAAVAEAARAIFREYDPAMGSHSLDEAYLDLSAYVRHRQRLGSHDAARRAVAGARERRCAAVPQRVEDGGEEEEADAEEDGGEAEPESDDSDADSDAEASDDDGCSLSARLELAEGVVSELRSKVKAATGGLTCSAGIGPTFALAKVCADQRKPDGQFSVAPGSASVLAFLRPLPVRKVGGIGRVLEKTLSCALHVSTCGQLLDACLAGDVALAFTKGGADSLLCAALGTAPPATPPPPLPLGTLPAPSQKGLSAERTFAPTARLPELLAKLDALCSRLAAEMAASLDGAGLACRTVSLKLKTDAFDVRTRDSTGSRAASAEELGARVRPLLEKEAARCEEAGGALRLRLLGVRASRLERADAEQAGGCAGGITRFLTAPRSPAGADGGIAEAEREARPQPQAGAAPPGARRLSPAASPPAKYARLGWAELDPAVLAELPHAVREQLADEMAHAGKAAGAAERAAGKPAGAGARPRAPCTAGGGARGRIERFLTHAHAAVCGPGGPAPPRAKGAPDEERLGAIVQMGFSRAEAADALASAKGDTHAAVEWLLGRQS